MLKEVEEEEPKTYLFFGTRTELGFGYKGTVLKFKAMEMEMEPFLMLILDGIFSCHSLKFVKKVG